MYLKSSSVRVARLEVVEEGLDVRVEDPAMVLGADRPQLDALRQRGLRDRLAERSPHRKAVPDPREAQRVRDRVRPAIGLQDAQSQELGQVVVAGPAARGDVGRMGIAPANQRRPDALASPVRPDPALDPVDRLPARTCRSTVTAPAMPRPSSTTRMSRWIEAGRGAPEGRELLGRGEPVVAVRGARLAR